MIVDRGSPASRGADLVLVAHLMPPVQRAKAADPEAELIPAEADISEVAEEIVRLIELPPGRRPFRVHVDPSRDGSEVVSAVADRVRAEFLRRVGLEDLLTAAASL